MSTDYTTTSDLADYLGIDDADDDGALASAITAASRGIDAWCGRTFGKDANASARVYRPDNQWVACVHDFWDSATCIVKTDGGGTGSYTETWTLNTDYVLEPLDGVYDGQSGWPYYRIVAVGSRYFHTYGPRPRLQVTAKWGWAAVPGDVEQACKIKAARLFRRKDAPEGAGGFETGGFNVPIIRAAPREDPDVAALLSQYRQVAVFA